MKKYVALAVAAGALMGTSAVQAVPLSVPTSSVENGQSFKRSIIAVVPGVGENGAVFGCAVDPGCMDTTPILGQKRIGQAPHAGGGRWTTKDVAATAGVSSTKARNRVAASRTLAPKRPLFLRARCCQTVSENDVMISPGL